VRPAAALRTGILALAVAVAALSPSRPAAAAPAALGLLDGRPDAVVDLTTREGLAAVRGEWRYRDARVVEVDFRGPGPDLRPSGPPVRTYDVEPKAGAAGFDDAGWEVLEPGTLDARRGHGRVAFGWYRLRFTIPERVGAFDPAGSTVVLEVVVDDYAEVWVDGTLPRALGQTGGTVVRGFNAPNRVVVARDARPGQTVAVAVFAMNGPLSDPPANFIWVRSATLDFHAPRPAPGAPADVVRVDPALDAVVPPGTRIERLAAGFTFTEGPVWTEGALLFSDPNENTIWRWTPDGELSVFRPKSGYAGPDIAEFGQPGSNGLTLDREGRLVVAQHGNRRIVRLERNGVLTVLADRFEGRRLNSPNDLVYRADGTLFFTDPPFGLPRFAEDPRKELATSNVFCLRDGRLARVTDELAGPNGLAFSPDERFLYVGNWDPRRKVVMRYEVRPDCSVADRRVFFDMTAAPGEDAIDGVKVDRAGHVYVSGPGGLWILSPEGRHLGTLRGPEHPHNMAWGDADGRTLYLTARTGLYRVRLGVPGIRP
jgi:gluconolactonase